MPAGGCCSHRAPPAPLISPAKMAHDAPKHECRTHRQGGGAAPESQTSEDCVAAAAVGGLLQRGRALDMTSRGYGEEYEQRGRPEELVLGTTWCVWTKESAAIFCKRYADL